ncbi:MAG: DUF2271 domain-containing protein [Kofleriaceae bacterium]
MDEHRAEDRKPASNHGGMFAMWTMKSIGFVLLGLTAACYEPRTSVDELSDSGEAPPTGLFDDGGSAVHDARPGDGGVAPVDGGGPDAAPGCDLSPLSAMRIVTTTSAVGGRYAPKNVGAIWIETSGGQYVKTVERWGNRRAGYLTRWRAASGGDLTDAITGATLTTHVTHDRTWSLTDRQRCEIAAGNYQVVMELTDRDSAGASAVFAFTKGSTPAVFTPADAPNFHNLRFDLH